MSLSGLCQVCESTTAEHSCDQCGTQVCDEHYDQMQGVCVRCATELEQGGTGVGGDEPTGIGHDDTGPGTEMR